MLESFAYYIKAKKLEFTETAQVLGVSVANATEPVFVSVFPFPEASVSTLSNDHSPCILVVAVPYTVHIFADIVAVDRTVFHTRTRLTLPSNGNDVPAPNLPMYSPDVEASVAPDVDVPLATEVPFITMLYAPDDDVRVIAT